MYEWVDTWLVNNYNIPWQNKYFFTYFSFQPVLCSYLGYPRIYFHGKFHVDINRENNNRCNYCAEGFNPQNDSTPGSNRYEFVDTTVISVLDENGMSVEDDPIIGQSVKVDSNAKISDLDVACQFHSMLFGMKLRIESSGGGNAFYSDWTPSIIVQYLKGTTSQSMTTLTNIEWTDVGGSTVLQQLQQAVGNGNLVLKFSVHSYSSRDETGTMIGFIGAPSASDTLNVPGAREMLATHRELNTAPFEFDLDDREVRIDFSNSLPRENDQSISDLGNLQLGYLDGSCVQLLGDEYLPYMTEENGGIHVVAVDSDELAALVQNSQLVVVRVYDSDEGDTLICSESIFSTVEMHTVKIYLEEIALFVRPTGVYIDRLDRITKPSISLEYYVTEFGLPSANTIVKIEAFNHYDTITPGPEQDVLPIDGVIVTYPTKITDRNGFVTFEYKLNPEVNIPNDRNYEKPDCEYVGCPAVPCANPPCTIPIDGQVYYFSMCAKKAEGDTCQDPVLTSVMLAFSDYTYTSPPTWVDNVGPIFTLYDKVSPFMHYIMDLSDYAVVSHPDNIPRIRSVLTREFEDPTLMPTTRDLSPIKVLMILEWLDNTCYEVPCA